MAKVTVYTKAYNTKPYIEQCMNSVLSQTHKNLEYIVVDNGCTDGSSEIIEKMAQQDSRIQIIRFEKNQFVPRITSVQRATGDYYTTLDSDDWWESDYLERLLNFAQENNLDISCTGSYMHNIHSGETVLRKVDKPMVLNRETFALGLPWYHMFLRPLWGKLIRMDLLRKELEINQNKKIPVFPYGGDTLSCFRLMRLASCIGVDDSVLHHYRIHKKSVSYQYDPSRFRADIYLYEDAIDFLKDFGPVNEQNRDFLQVVYSNALTDTLRVIENSPLSPVAKLKEYRTILEHPLTIESYQKRTNEYIQNSRQLLLRLVLQSGLDLNGQENQDFHKIMQILLPQCGAKIQLKNLQLVMREHALQDALLQDNLEKMIVFIMDLIVQKRYSKQYNLGEIIHDLLPEQSPLSTIRDVRFFREYAQVCRLIFQGKRLKALEEITEEIMNKKKHYSYAQFLDLYLTLAALENHIPAFLFGKIRLAEFYFQQSNYKQYENIMSELDEMGISENEALEQMHQDPDDL